jgi:cyanophycin synthetase
MDYAHNGAGVAAMAGLTDTYRIGGSKRVVLAAPGDRRDEDIKALAEAAAGHYDQYICRRDDRLRDRGENEVPELLKAALLASGVPEAAIELVPDEQASVEYALASSRPGDLLVVFADSLVRTWKQIIYFESEEAGAEPVEPTAVPATPVATRPQPWERMLDDVELISDDRGVWIAHEEESD